MRPLVRIKGPMSIRVQAQGAGVGEKPRTPAFKRINDESWAGDCLTPGDGPKTFVRNDDKGWYVAQLRPDGPHVGLPINGRDSLRKRWDDDFIHVFVCRDETWVPITDEEEWEEVFGKETS